MYCHELVQVLAVASDTQEPTPGETAMNVMPSSENARAYCRVSIFSAALETLYAAPGAKEKTFERAMDPMADELHVH